MEDIPAQITKKLQNSLREIDIDNRTVVAVYLFGSNVKGDAGLDSDLDLAFLLDESAYRNDPLATVAPSYLAATNLGMTMGRETDVTILNAASLEIAYEVVVTGKCLLEIDRDKRMAYEIALRGMYFDFKPFLEELRSNCMNNL
jgi:predicted nucleotidyltransferase